MSSRAERPGQTTGTALRAGERAWPGKPPVPHEHGAWVILYAPLIIGFAAASEFTWGPAALLALAVTGAYLARHAAGLQLRRRGKPGNLFWLAVYSALFVLCALPLLLVYGRWQLLWVGAAVTGLFAVHSALLLIPARKRLDRTQWGELLAVGALVMTAPAAGIAARGALAEKDALIWLACLLYFSSGIFHVKMFFNAVKVKGAFSSADRWRAGADSLIFHTALLVIVAAASLWLGGAAGLLVLLAFLPVLARAFWGWFRLTNRLPNLKRAGILETVYALWFAGLLIAAAR